MFVNSQEELLEDVEPPYLTSISESQLSCRDFASDYHSSDTLEPNSTNTTENTKEENGDLSENLFFKTKKNILPVYDYKVGSNNKIVGGIFSKAPGATSLEFIDWRYKDYEQKLRFLTSVPKHVPKRLSVSLTDLKTLRVKCPFHRYGAKSSYFMRLVRNHILSRSKMFKSLPNLYFSDDCGKVSYKSNELRNILHEGNYTREPFGDLNFVNINEDCFSDFLVQVLIKRLNTLLPTIEEKDVMIFELLKSYDDLLIKHAEAENEIDKMRFGCASSKTTITTDDAKNKAPIPTIQYQSVTSHDIPDNAGAIGKPCSECYLGENNGFRTCDFSVENPLLNCLTTHRPWLYLLPDARKETVTQINLDLSGNPNVSTSQDELTTFEEALGKENAFTKKLRKEHSQKEVDSLSESEINFHWLEPSLKMNMDKLETESLDKSKIDFDVEEKFFSHDISISSEDDFSFESQETFESLGNECPPLTHNRILKNNFNFSYNKIITYAKTKRELISQPEFHQYPSLFYDKNKNGFYESLPNLRGLKMQDNYLDSVHEKSSSYLPCESDYSKFKGPRSTSFETADTISSKLEHRIHKDILKINQSEKSKNGEICMGEEKSLPQQHFSILNNNATHGKDVKSAYGEDKSCQNCIFTEQTGSNNMFDCDAEETNANGNKLHLEIKNYFGENPKNILPQYEKWQTSERKKSYFDESNCEDSNSLGSIKLEACDCWNKTTDIKCCPRTTIMDYKEELSSLNLPRVSPLCLELSSSMDNSLPIISTVSMDDSLSKCCEAMKSLEDIVTHDGGMEEMNELQINSKFGYISKRAPTPKSSSCIGRDMVLLQNEKPNNYHPKKISQLINSLNKADHLASKLKDKSEELKTYLSLQLENIT